MLRDVEISPAVPASPFASVADIKTYLGVSGSGEDALYTALATTATALIEDYCGRIIGQRTVTERVRLDGPQRSIVLQHAPAIEVTSVKYDEVAETLADFRLAKAMATLRYVEGGEFGDGADWLIVYTAGWASIPAAVETACKELVKSLYNSKSRDDSVQRESVTDVGDVTYFPTSVSTMKGPTGVALPTSVALLLEPYVSRFSV